MLGMPVGDARREASSEADRLAVLYFQDAYQARSDVLEGQYGLDDADVVDLTKKGIRRF